MNTVPLEGVTEWRLPEKSYIEGQSAFIVSSDYRSVRLKILFQCTLEYIRHASTHVSANRQ